ncbi:MAG TPA: tetratricopeptide repeat protein [Verrucomicrobiae bacterium]|jgi:tetratricopeptide (TPR) repeat protein|nr:tetratricopeptide repeat protein [Verrucomicrobiae bacterium]
MSRTPFASAMLGLLLASSAWPKWQQPADPKKPESEDQKAQPPEETSTAPGPDSSRARYDPFPAEQDIEVGAFYLHKGDLDAAISRFEDAIRLRSNFAKPRLLLGEVYERKGEKATAARYYKEYLKLSPDAPNAKKIQQKIEKLTVH